MAEAVTATDIRPATPLKGEKMEGFRKGEGGKDVGVALHLKGGEQQFSFALMIDPGNPTGERIINLPDSRRDQNTNLDDRQWDQVGILQQENNGLGNRLEVTLGDNTYSVSREDLYRGSAKVWLTPTTGFEVLDFDPKSHVVTIHRIKRTAPPVAPASPDASLGGPVVPQPRKSAWRRRLIPFIPAVILGSATAVIPRDSIPPPSPPAQEIFTEEGFIRPKPVLEGKIPEVPQPETNQTWPELDPSLRCPATKEYTLEQGDYLTKALVKVNGVGRYLTEDMKINVDQLYQDLICLVAQPENLQVLERSDPKVADLLKELNSEESRALLGPLTSEMLYDALLELNSKDPVRKPYYNQLVISYKGDTFQMPQFSFPGE